MRKIVSGTIINDSSVLTKPFSCVRLNRFRIFYATNSRFSAIFLVGSLANRFGNFSGMWFSLIIDSLLTIEAELSFNK